MAVLQTNIETEQKISLPRRIATYISSMNFAKVFRRHHHHHPRPRESTSPVSKSAFLPQHHHQYSRPFSYHIPATEHITPSSLIKTSNSVPYRIGLSSDSALFTNAQTNETDEIVRLPIKNGRGHSPKSRKDRRHQSQLNANKRWLFRSMEALDGWKERVFAQRVRTTDSSQSRSRSVENLADKDRDESTLIKSNPSLFKQQRAATPNRSIDAITNRVINNIGIHRKSTNSIPTNVRSPPALTIEKQLLSNHQSKQYTTTNERNPSAILDFRELSALGFSQTRLRFNDENETNSITQSENIGNSVHLSDDENDEATSNLSFHPNGCDDNEASDAWDFSITWIDSLKEQNSPQRKIQFYENLIKLLEQDTLNIDELLVLRKILAKIWPTDETNPSMFSMDSKINGTRSLHTPNKIKQRPKLPTIPHHTAQRCSAILEPSPLAYEPLHEHNSGHGTKSPTKAKPCFIENNYPQHLNPFDEEKDLRPSAPPTEESNSTTSDSIRRYFERLTLLETIYAKLNSESNKKPSESIEHHPQKSPRHENTTQPYQSPEKRIPIKEEITNHLPKSSPNKLDVNKPLANKFVEMNVDGNGSISSGKSSTKRRAPTAPHVSQSNNHHPPMFTLSSTDVNIPRKPDQDIHIPIQIQTSNEKAVHDIAASCDDDGHIFVYDSQPNHFHEEPTVVVPRKTERIQQWLSTCETKEEMPPSKPISPNNQYKMHCMGQSNRHPSVSPQRYHAKTPPPPTNIELEPTRYRSCLKIHLETNEQPLNNRSRASSATSKHPQRQQTLPNDDLDVTEEEYFQHTTLSPVSFQRDHQAVFL